MAVASFTAGAEAVGALEALADAWGRAPPDPVPAIEFDTAPARVTVEAAPPLLATLTELARPAGWQMLPQPVTLPAAGADAAPGLLSVIGPPQSPWLLRTLFELCRELGARPGALRTLRRGARPSAGQALELSLDGRAARVPAALERASERLRADVNLLLPGAWRPRPALVCFDMDSTLIKAEVIDELAREAGVGDRVSTITERAMRGELDFAGSFRERLALLRGLPEAALLSVLARLELNDGARELVAALRARDIPTAILSGGFDFFARHFAGALAMDHVFANALEVRDGAVTGRVCGAIVDGAFKRERLQSLTAELGADARAAVAIGDGANDLPMLGAAGLGVAFRAKPRVRARAAASLDRNDLSAVTCLLGWPASADPST